MGESRRRRHVFVEDDDVGAPFFGGGGYAAEDGDQDSDRGKAKTAETDTTAHLVLSLSQYA
jgi:hypothetical protein